MRLRALVRLALAALGVASVLACATPARPYGKPDYVVEHVPAYSPPARKPVKPGRRMLVIGALDDLTVQPIGGQYNEYDNSVGPLLRTFNYWALSAKLVDVLYGAFRSQGVRVVKNYLDLGAPQPFPPPHWPRDLVVLRGEVVSFGYSRHHKGFDVLIGTLRLRLIDGATGKLLWRGVRKIAFKTPIADMRGPDPFALFGEKVVGGLVTDARFRAALGG